MYLFSYKISCNFCTVFGYPIDVTQLALSNTFELVSKGSSTIHTFGPMISLIVGSKSQSYGEIPGWGFDKESKSPDYVGLSTRFSLNSQHTPSFMLKTRHLEYIPSGLKTKSIIDSNTILYFESSLTHSPKNHMTIDIISSNVRF